MDFEGIPPNPEDFKAGAGDEKLLVVFYRGILQDEGKSIAQGRPIFNDVDWVRIYVPGDKTTVVDRPAFEIDKRRFATQFAKYSQGLKDEDQTSGTPLKEWPLVTRAQVEELRYFHIHTVEQLAEVNDAVKLKITGLTSLARQAAIWLERTSASAEAAKANKLIEDQNNRMEVLERTVRELSERNESLSKKLDAKRTANA